VWGRPAVPARSDASKSKPYEIRPKLGPGVTPQRQDTIVLPESGDRRMLELRLLHQYTADTSLTMNVKTDPNLHVWATTIPRLAFRHNALLYAIYTIAALHIANLEPGNQEHISTYQKYLGLTLREHRNDVANLGPANADATALTSSFLRVSNFALLKERQQHPYTPPVDWLHMSSTTGQGLNVAAWQYIHNDEKSIMRAFINTSRSMSPNPSGYLRNDEFLIQEANRRELLHLMRRTQDDILTEPWNAEIVGAYETTISYIGAIQLAIQSLEPPEAIFGRIILFPQCVETNFITLVQQQRPRALVILAHYFAYLTDFRYIWWIGEAGPREVRSIESVLPDDWLDLMVWPLQAIDDVYILP